MKSTTGKANVILMDMLGKVIYSKDMLLQNGSLNTKVILDASTPNGSYMLQIQAGNNTSKHQIMIEK